MPTDVAQHVASLPPVSTLFASFLGYNPLSHLINPDVMSSLPLHTQRVMQSREFFPSLISGPFRSGLHAACDSAVIACLLAAGCSWMRGGKFVYVEGPS